MPEYFFDVEQGSPEWFELRRGVPTASHFGHVAAGGDGKVRSLYMRKLAGEIVSGVPREDWRGDAMDRGQRVEPELRSLYAMMANVDPTLVGFVRRTMPFGLIGCSPDCLVGEEGVVEFKSAAPHILIEILDRDKTPPEHLPQCQGALLVTGRQWCDLAIGYPGMPLFRRRLPRDESAIARMELALEVFQRELDVMVERVRNYGRR